MGDKIASIISLIKEQLSDKPLSINQIAKTTGLNWRTVEDYLKILKDLAADYLF